MTVLPFVSITSSWGRFLTRTSFSPSLSGERRDITQTNFAAYASDVYLDSGRIAVGRFWEFCLYVLVKLGPNPTPRTILGIWGIGDSVLFCGRGWGGLRRFWLSSCSLRRVLLSGISVLVFLGILLVCAMLEV